MRRGLWVMAAFAPLAALAADPTPLEIQGEPVEAAGSQVELAARGKSCFAQVLRFDSVQLSAQTKSTTLLGAMADNPYNAQGATTTQDGGAVVQDADLEGGTVVGKARTSIKSWTGETWIQTTVTLETKAGKFRIRHSNILFAFGQSGLVPNQGFQPLDARARLAKDAAGALAKLDARIVECVKAEPKSW